MKRRDLPGVFFVAILLSGAGALAQSAASGATQAAPQKTASGYRIAGTVVNAGTGEPVSRAMVTVLNEANRETVGSAETDNEGRFAIEGLAAGKYPLSASKRGFLTGFYNQHDEGYSSAIVTGEGQETGDIVFRLSPGATLHGVVTGDGGDPVERAQVMLFLKPHGHNPGARINQAGNTMTDDLGAYEFDDLMPGEYLLAVKAEPWFALHRTAGRDPKRPDGDFSSSLDVAYPVTFFDSTTEEGAAKQIALAAGSREEANVNLHAVPAVHLFASAPAKQDGVIVRPLLRQSLFGTQTLLAGAPSFFGRQTGDVEFAGVAPGHYELTQGDPPRIVELDATTSQQIDPNLGTAVASVAGSLRAAGGSALPENLNVFLISREDGHEQAPLQAG